MPIYEYQCKTCATRFEELVRDSQTLAVHCPKCGAKELNRLLSVFAANNAAGVRASTNASVLSNSGQCCGGSCGCH